MITTVSSEAKADHARAAGADEVIDYKREDVAERVLQLTGDEGVDRIVEVEFAGNLALNMRVARMGAVIAAYGSTTREPKISFFPLLARNLVIRMVHMYGLPQSAKDEAIRDISEWSGTAGAQFAVAARFPLDQIVAAHQMVEAGAKVGHVLLEV